MSNELTLSQARRMAVQHDMVLIPRAHEENLWRAVWELMRLVNGPRRDDLFPGSFGLGRKEEALACLGLMQFNEWATGYQLTATARDLHSRMKGDT